MSKLNLEKLGSELSGPFLQAFKGDMSFDKAAQVASYNMMMVYLMDVMSRLSLKYKLAGFLFNGFVGSIFTYGLSILIRLMAKEGIGLGQVNGYQFFQERNRILFESNMKIYNNEIDLKDVITEEDKNAYKNKVKSSLSKFFDLSKFFRP